MSYDKKICSQLENKPFLRIIVPESSLVIPLLLFLLTCQQCANVTNFFFAAEKNLAQINDAVNGLLERSKFPCYGTVPMFNLAVVFKKGYVYRESDEGRSYGYSYHARVYKRNMPPCRSA